MKTTKVFDILLSEHFKVRKNIGFVILLLFPLVMSAYLSVKLNGNCEDPDFAPFFWTKFVQLHFTFYQLFYPLIVSLVVSSYYAMEFRNCNVYRLFLFPVPRIKIYFAKVMTLCIYVMGSLVLAYSALVISGNVLTALHPESGMGVYDVRFFINLLFVRTLVHILAVLFIQTFLSMVFEGIVMQISFAMLCTIICFIATKWKYRFLVPYGGLVTSLDKFLSQDPLFFSSEIVTSLIWIGLFGIISSVLFCKLNIAKRHND